MRFLSLLLLVSLSACCVPGAKQSAREEIAATTEQLAFARELEAIQTRCMSALTSLSVPEARTVRELYEAEKLGFDYELRKPFSTPEEQLAMLDQISALHAKLSDRNSLEYKELKAKTNERQVHQMIARQKKRLARASALGDELEAKREQMRQDLNFPALDTKKLTVDEKDELDRRRDNLVVARNNRLEKFLSKKTGLDVPKTIGVDYALAESLTVIEAARMAGDCEAVGVEVDSMLDEESSSRAEIMSELSEHDTTSAYFEWYDAMHEKYGGSGEG